MTRDEVIRAIGEIAVKAAEKENCEMTGRLLQPHQEGLTEWNARGQIEIDDTEYYITVYYLTDEEDQALAEEMGWDAIDWPSRIDRYEFEEI
ncbi:MAG: hypothetical protein EOM02_10515 [Synergistales bacterium]|nr:hypothetical protein [Synergistales bacterium]